MIRLAVVDRYVLKKVATPLLTAMAIGLLVLMADRLVRLLEVTLGKKNSFAVVFELLGYLVPHYLGLALPAAMFLGLLFGFNKMSKDSEIDAFMAPASGCIGWCGRSSRWRSCSPWWRSAFSAGCSRMAAMPIAR
jgi:hypothetical protein